MTVNQVVTHFRCRYDRSDAFDGELAEILQNNFAILECDIIVGSEPIQEILERNNKLILEKRFHTTKMAIVEQLSDSEADNDRNTGKRKNLEDARVPDSKKSKML